MVDSIWLGKPLMFWGWNSVKPIKFYTVDGITVFSITKI